MLLTGVQSRYPSIIMETRKNWKIPNEMRPEAAPHLLKASLAIWSKARPNARLRSFSGVYNCIGMVIASRRTWVDPEDLLRVLKEDGYRKLANESEAVCGDVVVYRDASGDVCHAGIVLGKNRYDPENPRDTLVVLSKWGGEGEYEHDASHVPIPCGKPAEYWTDRKGV